MPEMLWSPFPVVAELDVEHRVAGDVDAVAAIAVGRLWASRALIGVIARVVLKARCDPRRRPVRTTSKCSAAAGPLRDHPGDGFQVSVGGDFLDPLDEGLVEDDVETGGDLADHRSLRHRQDTGLSSTGRSSSMG